MLDDQLAGQLREPRPGVLPRHRQGSLSKLVGLEPAGFHAGEDIVDRRRERARISAFEASIAAKIGALKESIEARDFRLDGHGRRLSKLEESLP